MDIVVRFAKQIEIDAIAKILKEEFNKKPYEEGWTLKTADIKIKYYFQKATIKVALIDNKIVGFLAYTLEPSYNGILARIKELAVSSEFQGMGVGLRLVSDLEREAKIQKVNKIISEVNRISPGNGFYKKIGYKESGVIGFSKEIK